MSLTAALAVLPSVLVTVAFFAGSGDVNSHQPAMTAPLSEFAELSAHYRFKRRRDSLASLEPMRLPDADRGGLLGQPSI